MRISEDISQYSKVSIPQAVSAVATRRRKIMFVEAIYVSIPQAVSAVATVTTSLK